MERRIETVIVGGGQAGLSLSYYLRQAGREHVILERADRPAHAWRDDRWDSFTLVTPNWAFRLPGAEYQGPDPDGFMGRDEILQRFDQYTEKFLFPLELNVRVTSVDAEDGGYLLQTSIGVWHAHNVVIATGALQTPRVPIFSKDLPGGILQLPSGQYRNPQMLPSGAVLVVGSGQSACQISEELYQAGLQVYHSVGSTGRVPRRYRGQDIVHWLALTGFFNRTVANLPTPNARFSGNPQVTGKNGGHTLNLHQFYRDGVHLLGRITGFQDGKLILASDLKESLSKCDQAELRIIRMIDEYIRKNGINAPEENLPILRDGYDAPEILSLDFMEAGINTVIWAMGYRFDYSLVHQPVFDEFGFPNALTSFPGLFFVGIPWLPMQKHGLLLGVGEVAQLVAEKIG